MNRVSTIVPPVDLEDARLEVDPETGRFRDRRNREVVLRGINTGGRSKWSPYLPFELRGTSTLAEIESRATDFFRRVAQWGLDTVRLPFSWEALEPQRGQYDEAYRARYRTLLDAAWSVGLRVIVDFHQDIFASPFCGDGFPLWAVPEEERGPARRDHPGWFFKYAFDPGVRRSFERFWTNEEGLRDAFLEMWASMAETLGDHPAVVGFEPINEPGWGDVSDIEAWKRDVLTPFYSEVHTILREIAPDVLVFYDAPGVDALYPRAASIIRPTGEGFIFAPHYYDNGIIHGGGWSGGRPGPVVDHFADFRAKHSTPVLVGEFGVGHGAHRGMEWLERLVDALDHHHLSATLWECSETNEKWNGEDLNVLEPDGSERAILDTYARPWLRAVAGTRPTFQWSTRQNRGRASWLSDGGVTEIRVPRRLAERPPKRIEVEGRGTAHTWDGRRQELRIRSEPNTLVDVEFELDSS